MKMKSFWIVMFILIALIPAFAQPVLVEEAVEAAGLICFPVYGDSTIFKYLPSRGRLGMTDTDLPEFSFMRYAVERQSAAVAGSSITEADGGGLVHFLVLYDTPAEQVRKAESELRRKGTRSRNLRL